MRAVGARPVGRTWNAAPAGGPSPRMPVLPRLHPVLVALCLPLAGACGDPQEAEDTSESTGSTTAPTTSSTTTPTTSTTVDPDTGTSPTATTDPTTATGSSSDDGSSTEGGDTVTLRNDSFEPSDSLTWQIWPGPGDCWASTYEIDAGLYPFDIVAVEVAIGGADGVHAFELGIWELDGDGLPDQAIDTAMVDVEGNVAGPNLDVETLLTIPTIDSGGFAVVMCHVDHMGAPSIGIDDDDTVDAAHNFTFQVATGDWVPSPEFFGTDGDFVMRAIVRPL